MKHCDLCKEEARTYCESDHASLCWACDAMVHSANFLVARHSRAVLCHACHSPTPWISSGAELAVAVAACLSCVAGEPNNRSAGDDHSQESYSNDVGEDDGDSQVAAATPPPPASSEDDDDGEVADSPMKKRSREDLTEFLSSKRRCNSELATRVSWSAIRSSSAESKPLRDLRRIRVGQVKPAGTVAELAVKKFRPI